MVEVEVTHPLVAAGNAASKAVSGAVGGFAAGQQIQQQRQARADDLDYRDFLKQTRLKEMEGLAQERARSDERANRGLDLEERRTKASEDDILERRDTRRKGEEDMAKSAEFVAQMTQRALGATTVDKFEEEIAAQRANAIRFSAGLSPGARALTIAGLDDDERAERAAMGKRAAKAAIQQAAANPLLAQDASPMAEELKGLFAEQLDALESGAHTPAEAMRDLEQVRKLAKEHVRKQATFQWGLNWADQQIAEGGADIVSMQDALADYMTLGPEQGDLDGLKKSILKAKHGVGLDDVKLGKVSVPRNIRAGSPEWGEIAEAAADDEVVDLMARDPWVKQQVDAGGEFSGPGGLDKYLKVRERFRKSVLRKYGAQSGLTRSQMAARGWIDTAEADAAKQRTVEAIRARLKEAGIDPNLSIGEVPKPPSTRAQARRAPAVAPVEDIPLGDRRRPMLDNLGPATAAADADADSEDETFDEADIEAIYGEG